MAVHVAVVVIVHAVDAHSLDTHSKFACMLIVFAYSTFTQADGWFYF